MSESFVNEIVKDINEMSGFVLWRVTGTWSCNGRSGEINEIISARDAVEAISMGWDGENAEDLRTVSVEWLCPIESIKKKIRPAVRE